MVDFEALAREAFPINEDEWGSERQINAENALFTALEARYPETFGEASDFRMWALKATSEEYIEEAMRLVRTGKAH
jgi:hypothetical protein